MKDKKRGGFDLDESGKRKKTEGNSWFFGIGINEYKEFPDLNNAVKDVTDVKNVLVKKYNLPEENSYLILDEEAIEENIIDRFDKLAENVKEDDKLIIYYSGHGHLNKTTGLGYWIPHDAKKDKTSRYIRNSTIHEYIKVIKAKHILLISDSCFSGSLFARGGNRSSEATLDELETFDSRWAICSGRHDEEVYDGQPGSNSPFAESILNTLLNNQKKALNVSKLSDHVMEQTRSNYQQLPEGSPLYGVGHKGGQYVFRMKADEKESWATALKLGTLEAYRDYVDNHPTGKNIEEAKRKVKEFEDELAWAEAKRKNTITAYINYDDAFPEGKYSKEALNAIKVLEEDKLWRTATRKPTLYNYRNYLKTYPNGRYVDEAQNAMAALLDKQTKEGLKEMAPVKEDIKDEKQEKVKSGKPDPFKEEPEDKKETDITADPFEKSPKVTDDPFADKKYTGTPSGEVNLVKKYWKPAAGVVGILLVIWLLSGLFGGDGPKLLGALDYTASVAGDNILVQGYVNDDYYALPSEALPFEGASITLKGTNNTVYTDANGTYEISFPKGGRNYELVFDHPDYDPLTVEVDLSGVTEDVLSTNGDQQNKSNVLPGATNTTTTTGSAEKQEWEDLLGNISVQGFEDFVKKYPDSKFRGAAVFYSKYFSDGNIEASNTCYQLVTSNTINSAPLSTYSSSDLTDAQIECLSTPGCNYVWISADSQTAKFYSKLSSSGQGEKTSFYQRICEVH